MLRSAGRPPQAALSICGIVNPISGRRRGRRALAQFFDAIPRASHQLRVHQTRGPGDAEHLAREACLEGCDLIVVGGGDGTVREVIAGLPPDAPPLLVSSVGTENVLAKCLGLRADADVLSDAIRAWRVRELDVACCNGRRFLTVLGAGFDAEVVRQLSTVRLGHISYWHYVRPIWATMWGYRHPHLRIEVDGQRVFDDRGLVIMGNLPRYALGLRLLERADPTDGLIDVIAFPCRGLAGLIAHAARSLVQIHTGAAGVVYRQGRRVRLESDERVPYQMDGDFGGWLPAEIEMASRRVKFLTGVGALC